MQKAFSNEKTLVKQPAALVAFLAAAYAAAQAAREGLLVERPTGLPDALDAVLQAWVK